MGTSYFFNFHMQVKIKLGLCGFPEGFPSLPFPMRFSYYGWYPEPSASAFRHNADENIRYKD